MTVFYRVSGRGDERRVLARIEIAGLARSVGAVHREGLRTCSRVWV